MGLGLQIFLSYAREDQELVRGLHERLEKEGFNPWMDVEKVAPGERWDPAIRRALRTSDMVIICLSSASIEKRGYLQKEIAQALKQLEEKLDDDIYILPVRLENCPVPPQLAEIQWVDLFATGGWESLLKGIRLGAARLGKGITAPASLAVEGPPAAESPGALMKDFRSAFALRKTSPGDRQPKAKARHQSPTIIHNHASGNAAIFTGDIIGSTVDISTSRPRKPEGKRNKPRK